MRPLFAGPSPPRPPRPSVSPNSSASSGLSVGVHRERERSACTLLTAPIPAPVMHSIAWSFIPRGNDTHFTVVLLVRFGALVEIGAYHPAPAPVYPPPCAPMMDSHRYHSLFSQCRVTPPTPPPSDDEPSDDDEDEWMTTSERIRSRLAMLA
ncbi:hypothetical protein PIB30_015523 [Stylosanthes scabra]|uniref:Uncharacterized protein n=1 Tax=Stylosanthes scabra TaxID=79078 RepID=A0ABU6Y5Y0_9FABA|nr:hypothetical protein [Stylosanthes scabra]